MNLDDHKPRIILAMSEDFTLVPAKDERRHLEFARIAEAEGIHGLFVSEHVVMGPAPGRTGDATTRAGSSFPGSRTRRCPG